MEQKERLEKENEMLKEVIKRARLQHREAQRTLNTFLKMYKFDLETMEYKE